MKTGVWIADVWMRGLTIEDVMPQFGQFKMVVTVNADFLVTARKDARFRRIISDNVATFDGQVVYWLGLAFGRPRGARAEKISGSSLTYDLLKYCATEKKRVFFLGAVPEVNRCAVEVAASRFGAMAAGYSPPMTSYPFDSAWNDVVLSRVRGFRPDVLLVALGSPKQEFWIDDNREVLEELGVSLAMGCGGSLDFLAGKIARAPLTIQKLGLEGVYRLLRQPSLFRLKRLLRSCAAIPIVLAAAISGRGPDVTGTPRS